MEEEESPATAIGAKEPPKIQRLEESISKTRLSALEDQQLVGQGQILSSKDDETDGEKKKKSKTEEAKELLAKELLAKYGGAYLATSITLSLISFSLCYALVTSGVDVQALLLKVGISTNETGEKVGAFALAYAAHKAASPIRFPPTVALTPIVASWIGKKMDKEKDDD